jgi:CobW/HypB/UreG, nucleotide-binding domain
MIEKDKIVTISYTMKNGRGELLENRQTTYVHGSSAISPALQAQLEGLKPGQTKKVTIKKGDENADDDFIFEIIVENVREPMRIHLLSGFLGSGKTTAIEQACRLLNTQGTPTAVVTNDQGDKLVDGALFEHLNIPSRQVPNGCFCCNYKDLDRCIQSLTGNHHPAILFAESVGSCTDLVATVLKPLLKKHPGSHPTVSVFADAKLLPDVLEDHTAFDPSVRYIYLKQLEEAQVIVVSKTDQVSDLTPLRRLLADHYPTKTVLYQNSFDPDQILHWLQTLEQLSPQSDTLPSLNIDYDLYGAGEAKLAWLDQQLVIESLSNNAQNAALTLITRLSQISHPIGHLKCLLDGATKISFTRTGSTDQPPVQPAASASLLINARIQTTPATLNKLMSDAIKSIEKEKNCTIRTLTASCFQPGFPCPTHRIP